VASSNPNPDPGRYAARGASATKAGVHAAIAHLDPGLFPGAFCKITPDHLTGDPARCNVIHADGSGTKSLLAYLHWRETGDASVFRGLAQDSLVMNLDDLLCVGVTGPILFSNTINRNARNFPDSPALAELIAGHEDFIATLRKLGIDAINGGGETADVADLTATFTLDSCAVAIPKRDTIITGQNIRPGLAIVGLASDGHAAYETTPNSGIGSNGLTSARHDLLSSYYREKYPETFDSALDPALAYCGPYKLSDPLPDSSLTVGQALLSPTRTYAPVIALLLRQDRAALAGLVHCSGGGQTKCLRFGRGVHFIKDNLFPPPPIFRAIQKSSGADAREMHRVFNMGHRMEIYCAPEHVGAVIAAAVSFGIEPRVVGHIEASGRADGANHLTLTAGGESLEYSL